MFHDTDTSHQFCDDSPLNWHWIVCSVGLCILLLRILVTDFHDCKSLWVDTTKTDTADFVHEQACRNLWIWTVDFFL